MSTTAKWLLGIVVVLVVLTAVAFISSAFLPAQGYGMMGYGRSPMMGGYGTAFHGPFLMGLMWLIPLGVLILIVLGIAALVKYLSTPAK